MADREDQRTGGGHGGCEQVGTAVSRTSVLYLGARMLPVRAGTSEQRRCGTRKL